MVSLRHSDVVSIANAIIILGIKSLGHESPLTMDLVFNYQMERFVLICIFLGFVFEPSFEVVHK